MTQQKRQHQRFSVVDLEIRNREDGHLIGKILNISEGGMLAETYQEYASGTTLFLRVPFDQEIFGEIFYDFQADVIWSLDNAAGNFNIGLQLRGDPELQYKFLQKMISVYGDSSS